uniref:Uncharacterized protein n=1 Tax=Timema douglasi TaxID=61478 RepID=A0A7R8VE74_TIMDO|nr:unnamed protein product [Timema douglasi]
MVSSSYTIDWLIAFNHLLTPALDHDHHFLTEEWTLYERLTVECDSTLDCLRCVRNLQLLMHYV